MGINIFCVNNLGDYYRTISQISHKVSKTENECIEIAKPPTLWFRGQSNMKYTLIPSLFRKNEAIKICDENDQYSNFHYAEDIRTQHYNAKNYHYLSKEPSSRIEWLEVMQHHGVNTRVLDWSESSIHSLLFALEPFYSADVRGSRENVPCVWVLDPQGMNQELFLKLGQKEDLQKKLLEELGVTKAECKKIITRMKKMLSLQGMKQCMEGKDTYHINYLLNLSEISDEIGRDRTRLRYLLSKGEAVNPLFYLLVKIYSDGYILDNYDLPPLAVVHPYHSERIKAQKGVFSVFPFYKVVTEERSGLRFLEVNPDSMSYNEIVQRHLYKIVLQQPQKIAGELLSNGMNESWLYPEMPVVSGEIEHHRIS